MEVTVSGRNNEKRLSTQAKMRNEKQSMSLRVESFCMSKSASSAEPLLSHPYPANERVLEVNVVN